jgi:transposase
MILERAAHPDRRARAMRMARTAWLSVPCPRTRSCQLHHTDGGLPLRHVQTNVTASWLPSCTNSASNHFIGIHGELLRLGIEEFGRIIAEPMVGGLHYRYARIMKASLSAMRNKTDKNDARGIAQMMRVGLFRVVHVRSRESHELRLLLTNRSVLRRKCLDIENEIRGALKGRPGDEVHP